MQYQTAHGIATVALWKLLKLFKAVMESRMTLESKRFALRSIRDGLHEACLQFEAHEGANEQEDIYLPLFDALSFLNQALGSPEMDEMIVRAAYDLLTELDGQLKAAPAVPV
jgi:hypothetical protein